MSFFLILTVTIMAGAAVLIVKRRSRRGASRSGRYRSPRAGLNLERPADLPHRSRREAAVQPKSLAGPIFLALVVVVMFFWVVAAFFLPEGETRSAIVETKADASSPEQFSSLAGRLSADPGNSAENAAMAQTPAYPTAPGAPAQLAVPAGDSLMAAARSMAPGNDSHLTRVGLLPGREAAKPPPPPGPAPKAVPAKKPAAAAGAVPPPANPPAVQPNPNASSAPVRVSPAVPATPSPPSAAGPAVARSSVVSAASASSTPRASGLGAGAVRLAPDDDALISTRQFTVHLGSFTDQDNAEKYQSKLAASGESAFISQAAIEGRNWFRVMSGSFSTRAAAEAHGKDLKRRGLTADTGRYLIKSLD